MSWLDKWENAPHATKAGVVAAQRISLDDTDVAKFIADHPNESQSWRRETIIDRYHNYLANHRDGGEGKNAKSHYHGMFAVVCYATREILGGFVSGDLIEELQAVYLDSFNEKLGDRNPPANEFAHIARDAIADELAKHDPKDSVAMADLLNRGNRDFGSHHLDEINTAPVLDDSAFPLNGHESKITTESKPTMPENDFIVEDEDGFAVESEDESSEDETPKSEDSPPDDDLTDELLAGLNDDEKDFAKRNSNTIKIEIQKLLKRNIAQKIVTLEQWAEPDDEGSLTYQLDNPDPDPGSLVDELIPNGGSVIAAGPAKLGKTSLFTVNLTYALVTGKLFLGRFATHLGDDECVGIWNLELSKSMLNGWLSETGMSHSAHSRVFPLGLRGKRIDFDDNRAVDWAVKWFRDRNIKVWVIDPQSRLFHHDENSNAEFNRWWMFVENIAARAQLRAVVDIHHTGHSENASGRGRGASAMEGAPDVLISLYHNGEYGEKPKDSKRYLSALGRNVDVPETEFDRDPVTGLYYPTNSGITREKASNRRLAIKAWAYLYEQNQKENRPPDNPVEVVRNTLLTEAELPSSGNGMRSSLGALSYGVKQKWLKLRDTGTNKAKYFSTGTKVPPANEWPAGVGVSGVIPRPGGGSTGSGSSKLSGGD